MLDCVITLKHYWYLQVSQTFTQRPKSSKNLNVSTRTENGFKKGVNELNRPK